MSAPHNSLTATCPHCHGIITGPDENFEVEFDFDKGRILCWNTGPCPHCKEMISLMEEYILASMWTEEY